MKATSTTRQPRGAYAQGRATRLEILEGATQVFSRSGFRGGTLRDVAQETGITHGTIVHHFGTKDRLLLELLEHRDLVDEMRVDAWTAEGDFIGALRDLVATNAQNPEFIRLNVVLQAEATDPGHPAHQHFVQRYEKHRSYISSQLDHILPQRVPDRESLIRDRTAGITAMMDGLQLQWLLDPSVDMLAGFESHLMSIGLLDRAEHSDSRSSLGP